MKKLDSSNLAQPAKIAKREITPRAQKQVALTKTFSVYQAHMDYLSEKVAKLTKERGASYSFSEALRVVIEEHKEAEL